MLIQQENYNSTLVKKKNNKNSKKTNLPIIVIEYQVTTKLYKII